MNREKYKLCYIDRNKAWFTNDFEHQFGDDWDDSPYEDNAGEPYDCWSELIEDNINIFKRIYSHNPIKLKTLYFETDDWSEVQACNVGRFSVEDVNKGKVPWLYTDEFDIYAETEYEDFIETIKVHGGRIYIEEDQNE